MIGFNWGGTWWGFHVAFHWIIAAWPVSGLLVGFIVGVLVEVEEFIGS
jgi:hypothetical protein